MSGQERNGDAAGRIVAVVAAMLESGGYDRVQLADVAKQARVSLRTVYQEFGSREELILAAVESWMAAEVYQKMRPPAPGEPLSKALTRQFRHIFEPWERHPHMAQAFMRAKLSPGGERLVKQGFAAAEASADRMFEGLDPDYAADVRAILTNLVYGLAFRFAAGEIPVHEMRETLERAVRRLTAPAG